MIDFVARCASIVALFALVIIGMMKGIVDGDDALQCLTCGLLVMIYLNMGRHGGDGE